jgi:multiple sugar transport system substrate-binding protein
MIPSLRVIALWSVGSIVTMTALLLLVGCEMSPTGVPMPEPTPVVDSVAVTDTVTASARATPPITVTADASDTPAVDMPSDDLPTIPVQVTLWTVESVSPQAEGEVGEAFANGIRAFERRYPNVSVAVKIKNDSGKGSVLDYLRTASSVAPSVLPDVVILDTADLATAARAGVLVALDDRLAPGLINDLLPGARMAGTFEGQLVGMPFEADIEHIVYDTAKFVEAPLSWQDVLSANTRYRFPAKGRNGLVNDSFLIQYFALGGRLLDDEGVPTLDEAALTAVLEYYRLGVVSGVIPDDVLTAASADDLWPGFVSGDTGIVHVRARRFIQERSALRTGRHADVPTQKGEPLTILRGRALAITSRDTAQVAAAVSLIQWLMEPDNAVAWHQITATLPTRHETLQRMGDDPYWDFLRRALETAVPAPSFPQYDQIGRVLQQAVTEVIGGDSTPEEAAAAALDVIGR